MNIIKAEESSDRYLMNADDSIEDNINQQFDLNQK